MDLLFVIASVWLVAASITDLKKREVSDWLSFSLIAIAICIRALQSIIQWDIRPIAICILGMAIFFLLSNILYYTKVFAGGDAKLLIGLGAIMPSIAFLSNILVVGSIYGILFSIWLAIANWKKVLLQAGKINLRRELAVFLFLLLLALAGLIADIGILLWLALSVIFLQAMRIFVSATEKVALIKKVSPEDLTEGDWLFHDVRIRNHIIKSDFSGLTKKDISMIRKSKKKVWIKYGIPFVPVFLIAFISTEFLGNMLVWSVEKLAPII